MTEHRTAPVLFASLIVLASLISIWCTATESWRIYGEGERKAYVTFKDEFRKRSSSVVGAMLGDINRCIRAPEAQERGAQWTMETGDKKGPLRITYRLYFEKGHPEGVEREWRRGGQSGVTRFDLPVKSMLFSRVGDKTWKLTLFFDVNTRYGHMGTDSLVYTFAAGGSH